MPFWRPEPLTSEIESDGKPSASRSLRIGSKASCRMNASTFFMRGSLSGQSGRQDPVRLQPQAEPLPILAQGRVEPAELLHALEPVGDRVPVDVEGAGGGAGGAVVLEERLQGDDELRAV